MSCAWHAAWSATSTDCTLDLYDILSESDINLQQPMGLDQLMENSMDNDIKLACPSLGKLRLRCMQGDLPPMQIALNLYNILGDSDTSLSAWTTSSERIA